MTGLIKDLWRGSKRRLVELATDDDAWAVNWRSTTTKVATVALAVSVCAHKAVHDWVGLGSIVIYSGLVYLVLKTPKTPKF